MELPTATHNAGCSIVQDLQDLEDMKSNLADVISASTREVPWWGIVEEMLRKRKSKRRKR